MAKIKWCVLACGHFEMYIYTQCVSWTLFCMSCVTSGILVCWTKGSVEDLYTIEILYFEVVIWWTYCWSHATNRSLTCFMSHVTPISLNHTLERYQRCCHTLQDNNAPDLEKQVSLHGASLCFSFILNTLDLYHRGLIKMTTIVFFFN